MSARVRLVSMRPVRLLIALSLAAWASSATAQEPVPCNVPADYATVQAAVSDPACEEVVLDVGSYDEGVVVARTVAVNGAGAATTRLTRPLVVVGASTTLTLGGLAIDVGGACYREPLVVKGGATIVIAPGDDLPIRAAPRPDDPCPLFDDGFESATADAWSANAP